jgi:hypothetical protein
MSKPKALLFSTTNQPSGTHNFTRVSLVWSVLPITGLSDFVFDGYLIGRLLGDIFTRLELLNQYACGFSLMFLYLMDI